MNLSSLFSLGDLLFKVFSDMVKNILTLIYTYFGNLSATIIYYKKLFIILTLIALVYVIINFVWKNRENFSRFLWLPEPIMGGMLLNTFGQFFHNHLTNGLTELQKLLNTLPSTTSVVLIVGMIHKL